MKYIDAFSDVIQTWNGEKKNNAHRFLIWTDQKWKIESFAATNLAQFFIENVSLLFTIEIEAKKKTEHMLTEKKNIAIKPRYLIGAKQFKSCS